MPIVLLLAAIACELDPPSPPVLEIPFDDDEAQVRVTLVDEGGFPDAVASYTVEVRSAEGHSLVVMRGRAQTKDVRGDVVADRLSSGALAIALQTDLCLVADGRGRCADLVDHVGAELIDALRWRAGDSRASDSIRAHAALALGPHDRWAAIEVLDEIDPIRYADPRLAARVRGVLARLRGRRNEIEVLRQELPSATHLVVIGLARACVPELENGLLASIRDRPDYVRAQVESDLATCRR